MRKNTVIHTMLQLIVFLGFIYGGMSLLKPWLDHIPFPRKHIRVDENYIQLMDRDRQTRKEQSLYLGIYDWNQGNSARAIFDELAAVKLKPKYAEAYKILGFLYYKTGQKDKAVDAIQHAWQYGNGNEDIVNVMNRYGGKLAIDSDNRITLKFDRLPLTLNANGLQGAESFAEEKNPLAIQPTLLALLFFALLFFLWTLITENAKEKMKLKEATIVIGKDPKAYLAELEEKAKAAGSVGESNFLNLLQAEAYFHVQNMEMHEKFFRQVNATLLHGEQRKVYEYLNTLRLVRLGKLDLAIDEAKKTPEMWRPIVGRKLEAEKPERKTKGKAAKQAGDIGVAKSSEKAEGQKANKKAKSKRPQTKKTKR
jgi:hypothetical protein